MEERLLPGLGREFCSDKGSLRLFSAGPLLVAKFRDYGEADFARPIIAKIDAIVDSDKRIEIFFELGSMTNYHTELRTRLTTHCAHRHASIASFHVYARSRIVGMGVSVANLALDQLITVHASLSSFNNVLDAVVRDTRTLGFSSSILQS